MARKNRRKSLSYGIATYKQQRAGGTPRLKALKRAIQQQNPRRTVVSVHATKAQAKKAANALRAALRREGVKKPVRIVQNPTGKFARCVKEVSAKGGAYDPKAVCATKDRRRKRRR